MVLARRCDHRIAMRGRVALLVRAERDPGVLTNRTLDRRDTDERFEPS